MSKKPRPRTYGRNRPKRRIRQRFVEADGIYFLKLVIVILLGTLWLKFQDPMWINDVPVGAFPFGMIVGLIIIRLLEKDPINRKIGFAVLIVVAIVCYNAPAGIVL